MTFTLALNLFLFLIFLTFSYYALKRDFKIFYILLLFYFQGFNTIASLTYIEEGVFINEQGRDGYFVGSVFFYIVFFFLTIVLCEKTIKYLDKNLAFSDFNISLFKLRIGYRFLLVFIVLVLFLLYLNVYLSPSPIFSSEVTRFTYWQNSRLSFLNGVFGNTSIFVPFALGILIRKYRYLAIALLVLYFLNMVLIGQKFSPIISGLYAFFFPIVMRLGSNTQIRIRRFLTVRTALIFLALFSIVYYKYSLHNPFVRAGAETPFEAIIYRAFGLQAHIFWGCVENYVTHGMENTWRVWELNQGMHHLMRHFYPGDIEQLNRSISIGFSFTNAYPAILLRIFPVYLSYFAHAVLMIFVLGPLLWMFKKIITGKNVVFAVISFQLFNWVVYAFKMGYFYKLQIPVIFVLFYTFFAFMVYQSRQSSLT